MPTSGRDSVRDYFRQGAADGSDALEWRMKCYSDGEELANLVSERAFPLTGRTMLDAAAGWGGHLLAFAERGTRTVAADLNDHTFKDLQRYATGRRLDLSALVANCESLPFEPSSFDIILGLELIEHIDSVERFAMEVARILKPGGILLLSTPPRFKVFFEGEPHYHLRFLPILPFRMQGFVARKFFNRSYPFPIRRQFLLASSILAPFRNAGLTGEAIVAGRLRTLSEKHPAVGSVAKQLMFKYVLVRRPSSAGAV